MKFKLSSKFTIEQNNLQDFLVFEIKETKKGKTVSTPFIRIDDNKEFGTRQVHFMVSPETATKLVAVLTKKLKRTRK